MPIKSEIKDGLIHTELSDEINFSSVIQHIDFILSCKDKLENHYELHDFTNVEDINLSSNDMNSIAAYGMQTANIFSYSAIAIYVKDDFTHGMARMFEISIELSKNPTTIKLFKNRDDAIQFLKDEMAKNS